MNVDSLRAKTGHFPLSDICTALFHYVVYGQKTPGQKANKLVFQ